STPPTTPASTRLSGESNCPPPIRLFSRYTATPKIYTLSLHDALPIFASARSRRSPNRVSTCARSSRRKSSVSGRFSQFVDTRFRSEEHTSELQSRGHLVCRLLLEKKKIWRLL